MDNKAEKKFYDIADKAIEKAERIDCNLKDFAEGLEIMRDQIRCRLECVREELS